MKDSDDILDAKQEAGLCALLAEGTLRAAARKVRVSEATFWRWMQVPAFQSRYRAARRQLVETAIAQLQNDATVAVRVLREVAEDTEAPASARVSAARTILEQAVSAVELIDLQERVEQLEARQASGAGRQTA